MHTAPVRRPSSWWWFLIPVLSLGFGTFVGVFVAATRLKSRAQMFAAGGYLLVNVVYFGIAFASRSEPATGLVAPPSAAVSAVAYPFLAVNWGLGTLHTLGLQWLAMVRPRFAVETADPAMAAAARRAAVRAHARHLAETDPALAGQLRIGRPDLPGRVHDDGGLVDVNHVPAEWIAHSLQLPRPVADRIVAARELRRGLRVPEELVVHCDGMTPDRLAVIRDFLLFLPF